MDNSDRCGRTEVIQEDILVAARVDDGLTGENEANNVLVLMKTVLEAPLNLHIPATGSTIQSLQSMHDARQQIPADQNTSVPNQVGNNVERGTLEILAQSLAWQHRANTDLQHCVNQNFQKMYETYMEMNRNIMQNQDNVHNGMQLLVQYSMQRRAKKRVTFAEGTVSPRKMTRSRLTAEDRRMRGIDEPRVYGLRSGKAVADGEKENDKNNADASL